ncbi:hypothetical protein J7K06_03650 [Candidatus Bathyarchaeota archaeon]|nr:hypothetical protein [Candidatus Bathyarchaeota archaeon]
MKGGQIIQTFTLKDGRKAVIRAPRWEDLDDLMDFINSLVRGRMLQFFAKQKLIELKRLNGLPDNL